MGSRGNAPRVINLGIRWEFVVSFTLRPLYPEKEFPMTEGYVYLLTLD